MTAIVTTKSGLTVPASVRRRAGIRTGDRVEFRVSGGVITIVPKLSAAADEYTPERRGAIVARLQEAERGLFYGPFSAKEATVFLNRFVRARSKAGLKRSR